MTAFRQRNLLRWSNTVYKWNIITYNRFFSLTFAAISDDLMCLALFDSVDFQQNNEHWCLTHCHGIYIEEQKFAIPSKYILFPEFTFYCLEPVVQSSSIILLT
jgi:hypothetical protein